ncbi:MAG: hypothetical protein AAGJ81_03065 [Verrucomicrobiota bacterium]
MKVNFLAIAYLLTFSTGTCFATWKEEFRAPEPGTYLLIIQPDTNKPWGVFAPSVIQVMVSKEDDNLWIELAYFDGKREKVAIELLSESFFFSETRRVEYTLYDKHVSSLVSNVYSASKVLYHTGGMKFYSGIVSKLVTPRRMDADDAVPFGLSETDPDVESARFMLLEWPSTGEVENE